MSKSKQILISAGGTGGHMFPAEALARDLIGRGYHVSLATDSRGRKYEPFADGIPVYTLASAGLTAGLLNKVKSVVQMGVGYIQGGRLIKKVQPDVVIGFGGYPSFPAVLAASKKNIPTIIHEQNAILGKANAYLAPKVSRIAVAWPEIANMRDQDSARTVVTGNPVRPDISSLYNKPYPALEQDGELKIFIMGGSQGARVFSKVVPEALAKLSDSYKSRLQIVQQCREEDMDSAKKAYEEAGVQAELATFFKDVPAQLEQCHLFIGRSGASTVSEITTAGRPAIFVPYPHHADQQQKRNADVVADVGGAWVMTEEGFIPEVLSTRLEAFLQNPESLFNAAEKSRSCGRPDAARRLGNLVTALASGWQKDQDHPFS